MTPHAILLITHFSVSRLPEQKYKIQCRAFFSPTLFLNKNLSCVYVNIFHKSELQEFLISDEMSSNANMSKKRLQTE